MTAGDGRPDRRRVRPVPGGPVLVEGPVEVELEDGRVVVSDRFTVALCVCRRSRAYPFCDASHRRRPRRARSPRGTGTGGAGAGAEDGGNERPR
ncbi:CDGSH iron-sulfur domain-containing protein [Actinomadura sp. WMMB 499]|uniref:CDGSH iron-sulfur domain-containing protein n=1 Tax=Actinomadura sp. WMMB 499 TaxID=1219491 RepID=UPI001247A196|nr:CDGSH iron-sulfur domain-containing protein [Actinomadura sp. WMMB 499]QFG19822.1 CDGSH iron-sulfur domain-containing protein [Actinomadura sp. WMMB 499]